MRESEIRDAKDMKLIVSNIKKSVINVGGEDLTEIKLGKRNGYYIQPPTQFKFFFIQKTKDDLLFTAYYTATIEASITTKKPAFFPFWGTLVFPIKARINLFHVVITCKTEKGQLFVITRNKKIDRAIKERIIELIVIN